MANYQTSDYITMGIMPYDDEDIMNDKKLMQEINEDIEVTEDERINDER